MNQTERIRNYCNNNKGKILDLNYLSKTIFSDIPLSNLRKYITRLVQAEILSQIDKGFFVIGKVNESVDELTIRHYLFSDDDLPCGIPINKYLLYLEDIIDEEPKIKEIMSNKTFINRNFKRISVYYTYNDFNGESGQLLKILELINCESLLKFEEKLTLAIKLQSYLIKYNDTYFKNHKICYPRKVYLRLANLLNIMHISNRVMEIYENKNEIQHNQK